MDLIELTMTSQHELNMTLGTNINIDEKFNQKSTVSFKLIDGLPALLWWCDVFIDQTCDPVKPA